MEEHGRIRLASMKREYYETGVCVMECLAKALVQTILGKKKCRVVVEYDPAQDGLAVFMEQPESQKGLMPVYKKGRIRLKPRRRTAAPA